MWRAQQPLCTVVSPVVGAVAAALSGDSCWVFSGGAGLLQVRSGSYLDDGVKVPAGTPLFELVHIEAFRYPGKGEGAVVVHRGWLRWL